MKHISYMLMVFYVFQSCNVTLRVRDGQTAYDLKKYSLAVDLLKEDYDKAKDNNEKHRLALMIAKSYLAFSDTDKGEYWYKKAVDTEVDMGDLLGYALVLKQNEKYDEAISQLKLYYEYDRSQRLVVNGHIAACEEILKAKNEDSFTDIVNLAELNTNASEYAPLVSEGRLLFASSRQKGEAAEDEWTGGGYADVYQAVITSDTHFEEPELWAFDFNTPYHEAAVSYSPDLNEVYFTRCGMDDDNKDVCRIFRSVLEFEVWSEPEEMPFFDDSTNVGHPFISVDGKQLYFSSDAQFGYGGKDLYVSTRTAGEWGAPINLGPRINTPDDEMFPYVSKDDQLYFASSGHYGYGGLDLFTAERRGRSFTNVRSLGYPVNTGADDFSVCLIDTDEDSVEITGYLASNRKGGVGSDDLYFFKKMVPPAPVLPPPVFVLNGIVKEKILADPKNPNSEVTGLQPLPLVKTNVYDNSVAGNPFLYESLMNGPDGTFATYLDGGVDYYVQFEKKGYFTVKEGISTKNIAANDGDTIVVNMEVTMDKIFKEVEFVINNIYYDLDKWNIRPDAALVLDSLANILIQNPGLKVELGSHTDSRGSDPYNLDLSQKRAESAVEYLVSKGIDPDRMAAKGYGETRLVNECGNDVQCSEEKHQENRRTTFKILGFDFVNDNQ